MSPVSLVCPLTGFMGPSWVVGTQAGTEKGITGRKKAHRLFKYLVLDGKRGNKDELKKSRDC